MTYFTEVLADSPLGYWRLGESSGTVAADSSGNGRPGTYVNGPVLGSSGALPADPSTAVTLDGVNDSVNLGNPAVFQFTSGALEAWVKASAPGAGYRAVIVKQNAYGIFLLNGELITYDWYWDGGGLRSSGINIADGRWHHVALDVNNGVANGSRLYLDGVSVLSCLITVADQSSSLEVGRELNGSLDEAAVYGAPLGATRVAAHYEAGVRSVPDISVEIAFNAGYNTAAASRTWTDVSAYVEAQGGISLSRGRGDELSAEQPSRLQLTLDNTDGRFTPEYVSGAYYPNVKLGRPIRVRAVCAGVTYDRFVGYISEWPVVWPDGTANTSTVTITAASRMARMATGAELRSIIEAEILADAPTAYYPLGEATGAVSAGNVAVTPQPNLDVAGTGAVVDFGAGTGPGTDSLTAPVFSADGKCLQNEITGLWGYQKQAIGAFFSSSSTGATRIIFAVLHGYEAGGVIRAALQITTLNKLQGQIVGGGPTVTLLSTASVNDGATHHAALVDDVATGVVTLYLDGVSVATGSHTAGVVSTGNRLQAGGYEGTTLTLDGTLAHCYVVTSDTVLLTTARVLTHANSGSTGFSGEASGARISRLARFAGIAAADVSVETGLSTSIAHVDTTGRTPLDLMSQVADTESGLLFDGKDGTLTFHARGRRYNAAVAFTLDASVQSVEANLEARLDDQYLTNDVTASRETGVTARVVDTASVDEYGTYRETVSLVTTSDAEVIDAANWRLNRYATPRARITTIDVDVLNSTAAIITALLAADLGTKFTVSGLPAQAPAASADFFLEGITETIGAESYTISLTVSTAALSNVWVLDSASYSQLDSTTVLAY